MSFVLSDLQSRPYIFWVNYIRSAKILIGCQGEWWYCIPLLHIARCTSCAAYLTVHTIAMHAYNGSACHTVHTIALHIIDAYILVLHYLPYNVFTLLLQCISYNAYNCSANHAIHINTNNNNFCNFKTFKPLCVL